MLTCESCRFWNMRKDVEGVEFVGECRRYAPKMDDVVDDDSEFASWPVTLDTDWCGESQPK